MPIHVMLNELNVPFETQKIDLSSGEQKKPEFLKINSRGQIPVLQDGATIIREGSAIIAYLAEKHPTKLYPQSGADHLAAREWMAFCNATLHPAYSRVFFLKGLDIDAAAKEKALAVAYDRLQALWDDVEARLAAGNKYLAGAHLTIADVMMTVMANWSLPNALKYGANTQRVFGEVCARPSFQKTNAAEGVGFKAAA